MTNDSDITNEHVQVYANQVLPTINVTIGGKVA